MLIASVAACAMLIIYSMQAVQSAFVLLHERAGTLSHHGNPVVVAALALVIAFIISTEARLRRLSQRAVAARVDAMHRARLDSLTGLPNRRSFEAAMNDRGEMPSLVGVILLDIDDFRALRNAHGRHRADALLREFACRLAGAAPLGSTVARLHGDEFGIVTSLQAGMKLDRICEGLMRDMVLPYYPDGRACQMSLSIGAAVLPDDGATPDDAVNAAQLALEQAKRGGGRAWRRFDTSMANAATLTNALRVQLRPALASGQFVPYYQPIVRLATGEIDGFEVLARWQHPERGLLMPDEFISIADEQNECGQLSLALLRHVIQDAKHWPAHWHFAFNATPGQLRDLIDFVHDPDLLPGDMLDPQRIVLEITENALLTDMELARAVVKHMHRGGSRVVLDDFGTGYANFRHLRELDVDGIKIDKSFVQDMLADPRSEACVRAILALGQSLEVSVTAEGVETAETASRLLDMGCHYAQGYLYSRPVSAAAVASFAGQTRLSPQAA
jgi:diguanylate cyclase (GGDEF)-like protein